MLPRARSVSMINVITVIGIYRDHNLIVSRDIDDRCKKKIVCNTNMVTMTEMR